MDKLKRAVSAATEQAVHAIDQWGKFGSRCGTSRWFEGTPEVVVLDGFVVWRCPTGCGGHMGYNGADWMTVPVGHHHTCDVCGFTAAIKAAKFQAPDEAW